MAATPLPGFLGSLAGILNHYGYLAVGGLITLEDFGVPVPGETVLIAASVYAGAGRLNIVAVGVVAFVAAIIGDNIGFAIGHFGGRALVLRFGKYVRLTSERLDRAQGFFERRGGWIVVVARFIEGLRQANGIIAGIAGMHWLRFLAYNAIGAALWVGTWASVGYLAGNHIAAIYHGVTRYSVYALIAVVVLVILWIVRRRMIRRRILGPAGPSPHDAQPAKHQAAASQPSAAAADPPAAPSASQPAAPANPAAASASNEPAPAAEQPAAPAEPPAAPKRPRG